MCELLILYEGSTMASKERPANDRAPHNRLHASESDSQTTNEPPANGLKVDKPLPKAAANEARGVDPYNTSGSFDRKKHWERVGKR
jgi:hypothetical protein